jgi:Ca2+-binding EF-hand superfamily protein
MLIDLVQEEATFRDVELSDKFKPPLQMFFEKMDKDQKGFLTRDEFIEGMQTECSMADVVSKTELEQWFDETDVTGDKEVSWEEFEALCLDKLTFHSDYLGVDDV